MPLTVHTEERQKPRSVAQWREYDAQTSVLIDSLDNDEYQIALARARRRTQALDRLAGAEQVLVLDGEETEHATQCTLLGHFVVRDWKGAADANGNPVPYSPKAAVATLKTDIRFFLWVLKEASDVAASHHREVEETRGKSSPGTAGSASGEAEAKNKS
ncbi:hypothetical protein V8Z80_08545 [Orrella sp. JC864]|uniref:hypothetical protein n=1 Tax=Orrella sp. JC864 TaxID=3120298 RepID=UPI003007FF35